MEYENMTEQQRIDSAKRQIIYLLGNLDSAKLRRVIWYIMKIMV